jgi:hypothetical protein
MHLLDRSQLLRWGQLWVARVLLIHSLLIRIILALLVTSLQILLLSFELSMLNELFSKLLVVLVDGSLLLLHLLSTHCCLARYPIQDGGLQKA